MLLFAKNTELNHSLTVAELSLKIEKDELAPYNPTMYFNALRT